MYCPGAYRGGGGLANKKGGQNIRKRKGKGKKKRGKMQGK